MPASRSADVELSYTTKITDALLTADDFMSMAQLVKATGLNRIKIQPTLRYLRLHRAIDSIDSAGLLYWFLTPDTDDRTKLMLEHRKEDEPRRNKGTGAVKRARTKKMSDTWEGASESLQEILGLSNRGTK